MLKKRIAAVLLTCALVASAGFTVFAQQLPGWKECLPGAGGCWQCAYTVSATSAPIDFDFDFAD